MIYLLQVEITSGIKGIQTWRHRTVSCYSKFRWQTGKNRILVYNSGCLVPYVMILYGIYYLCREARVMRHWSLRQSKKCSISLDSHGLSLMKGTYEDASIQCNMKFWEGLLFVFVLFSRLVTTRVCEMEIVNNMCISNVNIENTTTTSLWMHIALFL